ncbi:MAG: SH3 domain-containing protein [Eubacteriales bacterium]|nr:SH3 domain-containing protein [Eubacteriales bacterium]
MKCISKRLLSLVLSFLLIISSLFVGAVSASGATSVVYTTDAVRLRSSATTNGDNIIVTLNVNEKLTLLENSKNEWAHVSRQDGTKGYCSVSYLSADPNGSTVIKGVTGDSDVNFRKEASTSSAVISTLAEGTKFTVLDNSQEDWVKVKIDSNTGYIYRTYVNLSVEIVKEEEELVTPDWFDSSSLESLVGQTIPESAIPHVQIALSQSSVRIEAGKSFILSVYSNELSSAQSAAVFSSSDTSVASVSKGGVVNALKEGTATISVAIPGNDAAAQCSVTVTKAAQTPTEPATTPTEPTNPVVLSHSKISLPSGNYANITANQSVTWKTSDNSVVAVNAQGLILGKSVGTATITATANGQSASCVVTVTNPPSGISIEYSKIEVTEGKTFFNSASSSKTITWTSSNESVAEVENGFITAKKQGRAIITASSSLGERTCLVDVKAAEPVRFAYSSPNTAAPNENITLYAITDKTRTGVKFDVTIGTKTTTVTATSKVTDGNTFLWSGTVKTSTAGTHKVVAYAKGEDGTYKTCSDANTTIFVRKSSDKTTETLETRRGSDEIITMISEFEGYSPCVYFDSLANGLPTLGYGRVVYVGDKFYNDMTKREAFAHLVDTVNNGGYTDQLNLYFDKYEFKRNQQQFDALLSFAYNLGAYTISGDSDFKDIFMATGKNNTTAKETDAYINDSGVNFRKEASTSSTVLAVLNYGESLTLLSMTPTNNWYNVKTSDGTKGYVYADYVTKGVLSDTGDYSLSKVDKSKFTKLVLQYHHAGGCVWGLLYRRVDELDVFYYGEYVRNGRDNKYDYSFTCPSNKSFYI